MSYARLAKVGNLYTQFMDEDERKRRAKNPEDEFERVTTEVGLPDSDSSASRVPRRRHLERIGTTS